MSSYIVIYLLFLLQFIYFPVGVSFFETPKVYLAQLGIFALFVLSILRTHTPILRNISKTYLVAFVVIAFLGLIDIVFLRTQTTFFGNVFRLQGVFLLWFMLLWAILTAKIKFEKLLHPYFLFGCLVAQLIASFVISGQGVERAIGTIGEPNALAATVIFVWPFLYFTKQKSPSWLKYLALAIVFLIVYISGSRSGMIGFLIQLIFVMIAKTKFSFTKNAIVCLILLVVTYALPFLPQTSIYEQRSDIWYVGLLSGWHAPIVGNGFGNTQNALENTIGQVQTHLTGSFVDSSHNLILDWWVQGGVIGAGALILILVLTIHAFIKKKKNLQFVLLLGLLAALSFNPASIVSLVALWWVIGQGMSLKE